MRRNEIISAETKHLASGLTANVHREFNELINMSASELKKWLGSEDSAGAGWSKDDGSGETIGHER